MPFAVDPNLARADEAIGWFADRLQLSDDEMAALESQAAEQAWLIATYTQARMVQDALDQSAYTLDVGEFETRGIVDSLKRLWAKPASRAKAAWEVVQRTYGKGRYKALRLLGRRKLWRFDAVLDGRTTPTCRSRDGVTLPAEHDWWLTNYPPLHFYCRSGVRAIDKGRVTPDAALYDAEPPGEGFGTPDVDKPVHPDALKLDPWLRDELLKRQA